MSIWRAGFAGGSTRPELFKVGVRSTGGEGVDLDPQAHAHVWRRYTLQAAHRLPNVRAGHKCGRMHGHGFAIVLHADRNQDPGDPTLSADRLDESWAPIHAELDHACLNDMAGLDNPTSEMISAWIWRRLKPQLPQLSWVTVYETANCGAHFDGTHYRIWKETSLDSASRSSRAPGGDVRRRIHGHTYSLRLHLQAPLDQVLGWIVDFGDVSELFQPIFERLDHRPLHEIPESCGHGCGEPGALDPPRVPRQPAADRPGGPLRNPRLRGDPPMG